MTSVLLLVNWLSLSGIWWLWIPNTLIRRVLFFDQKEYSDWLKEFKSKSINLDWTLMVLVFQLLIRTCWKCQQIPFSSIFCPQAGRAFTLCLELQRVNRESRRCACSPKNHLFAALKAMNSVRYWIFHASRMPNPNLEQHCFFTAPLQDGSKARSRGGAAFWAL